MSFIFPLLYLICFTYSLSLFIKKDFLKLLPFTFIISTIILFGTVFLFHTFLIGKIILILFSLLFPLKLLKEKTSLKEIKEQYLTKGFFAFLILYIVVFIFDFNRFFTRWDELSHWGMMVKEMFRLDNFYSIESTHLLVHTDYPPAFSLMEYFYAFISGGFKETYLIRAIHLFSGTLLLSCLNFENKKKKEIIFKTLFILLFTYLLTFLFDSVIVINSIYIDYPLALFVAVNMYHFLNTKEYQLNKILLMSFSLIFLLLTKQVAIAFYFMILFAYTLNILIHKIKLTKKQIGISFLFLLIIPLTLFLTWNFYIKQLGIVGQFNLGDIKINTFLNILKGGGESYQLETIKNYFFALFNKSLLNSNLCISYIQFFIILAFLIYLLFSNLKGKNSSKTLINIAITLGIGYIGYMVLMLLLYVYSFGSIEGPELASFERYMSTYILICFYLILVFYLKNNEITMEKSKKYITALFFLCILIKPISYAKLRPDLILLNNHFYDNYKESSTLIDKNVPLDSKIYIIDQLEKNGAVFYINYFSNKITTNLLNYQLVTEEENQELFYQYYFPYMKEYDYLYTFSIDEQFKKCYQFLTENPLKEKTLYKINKENKFKLEEVASH